MGPGEGAIRGLGRSAQLDGKWSKDLERLREGHFKGHTWQMMSCHVITGHAASAGNSMTRFASRSRQPLFTERRLLAPMRN